MHASIVGWVYGLAMTRGGGGGYHLPRMVVEVTERWDCR